MLSPHALYPLVQTWLQALERPCPPLALTALAHLVLALLTAQSLRPSALRRALLSPPRSPRANATSAWHASGSDPGSRPPG